MNKIKIKLAEILIFSLVFSQVGILNSGKILNKIVKAEAQKIANNSAEMPALPEEKSAKTIDWSTVNWDAPISFLEEEEEYRRQINDLGQRGKTAEIAKLKVPAHKMSDDKVMDYYSVPVEVQSAVREYREGKIDLKSLKVKVGKREISTDEKVGLREDIFNIKEGEKILMRNLNKAKDISGEVKMQVQKRLLSKPSRKLSTETETTDPLPPMGATNGGEITPLSINNSPNLIDYYEGIEKKYLDYALYYLSTTQNFDGSWGAFDKYEITAEAVLTLDQTYQTNNNQFTSAINYLINTAPQNDLEKAIKARLMKGLNQPYTGLLAELIANKNKDGGYGLEKKYESDLLTTMETALAFYVGNYSPAEALPQALANVLNQIPDDGALAYINGEPANIYLANRIVQSLFPFKNMAVGNIIVQNKINALLNFLKNSYDPAMEKLSNSDDLLDLIMTLQTWQMYGQELDKQESLKEKIISEQGISGDFGMDILATFYALKSLAISDLQLTTLVNTNNLINKEAATFSLTVKNNGYARARNAMIYIFPDNYNPGWTVDLKTAGIFIAPGEEITLNLTLPSTAPLIGETEIKFYIENDYEIDPKDNWIKGNFNFASANDGSPAAPLYYYARKHVIDGEPALSFGWPKKTDPNRAGYYVLYREKGMTDWWGALLSENFSSGFLVGFTDEKIYEITLGVLHTNGVVTYLSNITEVKMSKDESKYLGSLNAKATVDHLIKSDVLVEGSSGLSEYTDGNGEILAANLGNGLNFGRVQEDYYEPIVSSFKTNIDQTTSSIRFFTRLKEDVSAPVLNDLYIAGENDFSFKNQQEVNISFSATDNVAVKEADFYYYDPAESNWSFLGSKAGENSALFSWYVPETLIGVGYKIKAVVWDYQENKSNEKEWGSFEILDGSPPLDTEPPKINNVYINSGNDYQLENQRTVSISAEGEDNVSLDSGDFYYYNPHQGTWAFLGTAVAGNSTVVIYKWTIPAELIGSGFKVKASLLDKAGNRSEEKDWGSFEIIDGTLPSGSIILNLNENQWALNESKTINWEISSKNQLKNIGRLRLYYGTNNDGDLIIESNLDPNRRTANFTLPFDSRFVTSKAYFALENVCDVNNNCASIQSDNFKIIDSSPTIKEPWGKHQAIEGLDSYSLINRALINTFHNSDGTWEILYRETEGVYSFAEGVYDRLIYRKFSNGAWESPIILKQIWSKYEETEEIYLTEFKALQDGAGHLHLAYKNLIYPTRDSEEVFYLHINKGTIVAEKQISNNNTVSEGQLIALTSDGKVAITWQEDYSYGSNTGKAVLHYIEGDGMNNWSSIIELTNDWTTNVLITDDNNKFTIIVRYKVQFYFLNGLGQSFILSAPITRPDIYKSELDQFTADKDKFIYIVKNDPTNSAKYLWLENIKTTDDLRTVLTANNFVNKDAIVNKWSVNDYSYNSKNSRLFPLSGSSYDFFSIQSWPYDNYRGNIYQTTLNVDFVGQKTDLTKYQALIECFDQNQERIDSYEIKRNNGNNYYLIYNKASIVGKYNYSRIYYGYWTENGLYFNTLISPLSMYSDNYFILMETQNNKITAYFKGKEDAHWRMFINQADYTNIINYRLNNITPQHNETINKSSTSLKWEINSDAVDSYTVYFGTDPLLLEKKAENITQKEWLISGLESAKTYYWQIAAKIGTDFVYSNVYRLYTGNEPFNPEIEVFVKGTEITNNSSFNAGYMAVGKLKEIEFIVANKGIENLIIQGAALIGANAEDFSILQQPINEVKPGEQTKIIVGFKPISTGQRKTSLLINNNDTDESSYSITLEGTGLPLNPVLYHFNELSGAVTFSDSSGNNQNGSCSGVNCPTTFQTGKLDKAGLFDGAGDYINVADSTLITPKEQITMEALIYPQKNEAVSSQEIATKNLDYELAMLNNGGLRVGITNAAGTRVVTNMSPGVTFNQWNYLVMTYDGKKIRGYVNGKKIGEIAQTGLIRSVKNKPLTIGGFTNAFSTKGRIDEFGLYNYAWSDQEITDKYKKITTVLAYKFNETGMATTFIDDSGNERNGTCSSLACPTTEATGIIDKAISLDGAGDNIAITDSIYITPKEQITMEALIYPQKNEAVSSQVIATKNLDYELTILNNGGLRVGITNESGTRTVTNMYPGVTFDKWNYLVMTYDGQKIKGYVNGRLIGEIAQTGLIRRVTSKSLTVGGYNSSFSTKGLLDEFAIYNYAWSEQEIAAKYKTIVNDPLLVSYSFKEESGATKFKDDSINGLSASCSVPNCPVAGVSGKADTAVSFDGAKDVLQVGDTTAINPKEAISAEVWIYPAVNSGSSSQVILTKNLDYEISIFNNGTLRIGITNASGARVIKDISGVVKFGQWNYLVLTYDGQKIKGYVNGQWKGEKSQTGNIRWSKGKSLYLGGYNTSFSMKGTMDEVKIYDKALTAEEILAKYTALNK